MKREGIAFAGSMTVDHIKRIEALPGRSELAVIESQKDSTGGLVCNTGISMAALAPGMRVIACGVVGNDPDGDAVLSALGGHGIDTSRVKRRGQTSYTDVYAERSTSCRTFFQFGGANDDFDIGDIDLATLDARILHIGYLLLMKKLDGPDPAHGTRMARLLRDARASGVLTSVDVVTASPKRFAGVVLPALRHVDYLTVNELEAERITGVALAGEDGALLEANLPDALRRLMDAGVKRRAIIHAATGAWAIDAEGRMAAEPGKRVPPGFIGGTVGAGDAFCAGALLATLEERDLQTALRYGNAAALASLRSDSATGSVCAMEEALRLYDGMA